MTKLSVLKVASNLPISATSLQLSPTRLEDLCNIPHPLTNTCKRLLSDMAWLRCFMVYNNVKNHI